MFFYDHSFFLTYFVLLEYRFGRILFELKIKRDNILIGRLFERFYFEM